MAKVSGHGSGSVASKQWFRAMAVVRVGGSGKLSVIRLSCQWLRSELRVSHGQGQWPMVSITGAITTHDGYVRARARGSIIINYVLLIKIYIIDDVYEDD